MSAPDISHSAGPWNLVAPLGQVYVCGACGKTGAKIRDLRDASCMMHAVLCYEQSHEDRGSKQWRAVPGVLP